jgi:DNA-binding NtrC family response regulator
MKKIRSQAAIAANVDIPVLLLGESGTGGSAGAPDP